ncbi:MAG: heavy-metal-associated domain-containing protein [Desulfobacterales bacterium]|nr:heavy-metal-associated domain-containing protein [Desulfobacterales bacterium]
MTERIFRVSGMDCADETNALREAVGALSGIGDLKFNLLNGTMTVTAPEGIVANVAIIEAVERTGMGAQPAGVSQTGVSPQDAEFWPMHGRTLLCATSGIAVAAGFLSHWFLHGSLLDALSEGGEANPTPSRQSPSDSIWPGWSRADGSSSRRRSPRSADSART